jgi:hypothetical protein
MNIVPLFPFYLSTGFIFRKGKPFEYLNILRRVYIEKKVHSRGGGGDQISVVLFLGQKYDKGDDNMILLTQMAHQGENAKRHRKKTMMKQKLGK